MKLKILAPTALVTICTGSQVRAETVVDFKGWDRSGNAIIIIPAHGRHQQLYRPRFRYDRPYRPRYRYSRVYQLQRRGNGSYKQHYRYNQIYNPRRSYLQFKTGL